jgi:hypothetical protein
MGATPAPPAAAAVSAANSTARMQAAVRTTSRNRRFITCNFHRAFRNNTSTSRNSERRGPCRRDRQPTAARGADPTTSSSPSRSESSGLDATRYPRPQRIDLHRPREPVEVHERPTTSSSTSSRNDLRD